MIHGLHIIFALDQHKIQRKQDIFIAPYGEYSYKLKEKFKYYDVQLHANSVNPIKDIKTMFNLASLYKKTRPDVILHFSIKPNIYGTLAASILNIPTINNIAGLGTLFIRQNFVTKIV